MGDFEFDTRLEAAPGGDGRYRAQLSKDWEIWGPNGGYVAAIALRAAGLRSQIARPASFSCHFQSVARFGALDIEVTSLKMGRRAESLRVSLTQEGRPILEAMVRTAARTAGLEHSVESPPAVPDPETLQDVEDLRDPEEPRYPFWNNLECRTLHPERFNEEPRARDPRWLEWYRFRPRATFEDPWVDAGRLLLLIDTLSWPAAAQAHPMAKFTAPNLEVSAWFHRSAPESGWLLADHDCPVAEGGLMGTHGRVWSRDLRLLATGGAQLMCVPIPEER
jgi:acyl-CoA thioesterase II